MIGKPFVLMDRETSNIIGVFRSRAAALREVAKIFHRSGRDSVEIESLVLFREDVSPEEGFIAEGPQLADLAMSRVDESVPIR